MALNPGDGKTKKGKPRKRRSQLPPYDHAPYLDFRKSIGQMEYELSNFFDKYMLTLSAGALGLSLTFVKEIAPHPPNHPASLVAAWISFGVAISCILIGLQFSQKSLQALRDKIDRKAEQKQEQLGENPNIERIKNLKQAELEAETRRQNHLLWIRRLNHLTTVSFLIGIVFVLIFASFNFRKDDNGTRSKQSSGPTSRASTNKG